MANSKRNKTGMSSALNNSEEKEVNSEVSTHIIFKH